jgi:hypothetical protein
MANIVFGKNASRVRYGGGCYGIVPYDPAKKIEKTLFNYVKTGIDDDDTSLVLESTVGFPATGVVKVDSESITYSANDTTTGTLTISRGVGAAAHTAGTMAILIDASGYGDLIKDFGYIEDGELDTGIQEPLEKEDWNGVLHSAFAMPERPTLRVLHQQSGFDEIAHAFAKDIETSSVNGARRMSTTDLANFAIVIVFKEKKGDGTGYEWSFVQIANAVRSGATKIPFQKKDRVLEFNYKLLDGAADGRKYFWNGK